MKAGKIGALAAVLASACCVGPLLLAVLGLGSLGLGAVLGQYHGVLQGAAVVGLTLAWYIFLKERRRICCSLASKVRNERTTLLMLSLATVAVVAFLGLNLYTATRTGLSTPAALEEAQAEQKAAPNQAEADALVRLPVEGMTCFTCELSVESKLKGLPGVLEAKASASDKSVTVKYDPHRVTLPQMVQAIGAAGYKARLLQEGGGQG